MSIPGTEPRQGSTQGVSTRRLAAAALSGVERVSPKLAAYLDWVIPESHATWGGPMNGQTRRRDMVRQLAHQIKPDLVVETGTFRGGTTVFLADVTGAPVVTTEVRRRHYEFARWKLQGRGDIELHLGDSREVLAQLEMRGRLRNQIVLAYLDAHWGRDLPLSDEIEVLARGDGRVAIVIDDFKVPNDPGYGFDDYGPGARLDEALLPRVVHDWLWLYPAAPSNTETGARRGCVVLVPRTLYSEMDLDICGLRRS